MSSFVTIAVIVLLIILIHHLNTRTQLKESIKASARERQELETLRENLKFREERIQLLSDQLGSGEHYRQLLAEITKEVEQEILRALPGGIEKRLFHQMGRKIKAAIEGTVHALMQDIAYGATSLVRVEFGGEDIRDAIRSEMEEWTGKAITIAEHRLAQRHSLDEVGASFAKTRERIRQLEKETLKKFDPEDPDDEP